MQLKEWNMKDMGDKRVTREKYPKPSLNFVDFIFPVTNEKHFK